MSMDHHEAAKMRFQYLFHVKCCLDTKLAPHCQTDYLAVKHALGLLEGSTIPDTMLRDCCVKQLAKDRERAAMYAKIAENERKNGPARLVSSFKLDCEFQTEEYTFEVETQPLTEEQHMDMMVDIVNAINHHLEETFGLQIIRTTHTRNL